MRNIKLQNLRYFVAVYEEGSISAAARKVNATQSGVSVQLRDLEDRLGLTLLERISTGVTPTPAGHTIYRRALRILREVQGLEEDVADRAGALSGEVHVGIMPTFARALFAPVLARFSQAHPHVVVSVIEGYSAALTRLVLDGALDFAVVPEGDVPTGLTSTFLDRDLELLASHQPVETEGGQVDLARVPPLRMAVPGPANARRAQIDQRLRNAETDVEILLEMDSMMTTLDLVRRGGWSSILPGCLCLPDLGSDEMFLSPVGHPPMTVDYLMITAATRPQSAAARLFADELATEIRARCADIRSHFGLEGSSA